jgi:hypothetical protein
MHLLARRHRVDFGNGPHHDVEVCGALASAKSRDDVLPLARVYARVGLISRA